MVSETELWMVLDFGFGLVFCKMRIQCVCTAQKKNSRSHLKIASIAIKNFDIECNQNAIYNYTNALECPESDSGNSQCVIRFCSPNIGIIQLKTITISIHTQSPDTLVLSSNWKYSRYAKRKCNWNIQITTHWNI